MSNGRRPRSRTAPGRRVGVVVAVLAVTAACGAPVSPAVDASSSTSAAGRAPSAAGVAQTPAADRVPPPAFASPPPPGPKGPRPATGAVLVRKGSRGEGLMDIDNGTSEDTYVTLGIGGVLELGVYVRSGSTAHVTGVADGTYDLYYASGSGWNADMRAFTADASFTKFDDPFPYTTTKRKYSAWSVTLQPSASGNATTSSVDAAQVPR